MQLPDRTPKGPQSDPGVFTCEVCNQWVRNTDEDKVIHDKSRVHLDAVAFWSKAAVAAEEDKMAAHLRRH